MSRPRTAEVLALAVIGGWFVLVGVMLVRAGLRDIALDRATLVWPATTGRIVRSGFAQVPIDQRRTHSCTYEIWVEYEYLVGSHSYRSRRVGRTIDVVCSGADDLAAKLEEYRIGNNVTVFYAPASPDTAILERRVHASDFAAIAAVGVTVVGLVFVLGWGARRSWSAGEKRR